MVPDAQLRTKLASLRDRLGEVVIGQEDAVGIVAQWLQHGQLGLTAPGRPKASFLFLGPTGVGKTALARQLTFELLGPNKIVEIDLAEYKTLDRLGLLLGTSDDDPGRIAEGYDACGGVGTLLLDEIDKAHPRILDILLNLLEPARLTTGRNRVLDFSAWYVVLTSNIGAARIMTMRRSIYETMRRLVILDAQSELRPEIFNRITEAVVFNRLDYATQHRIADALVAREVQHQRAQGHAVTITPGVNDVVIKRGFHERLGARPMRNAAELLVRNALTQDLLRGGVGHGRLCAHPDGNSLQLESSPP